MLLKFLGIIWLLSAAWLFIKPQAFKTWLETNNMVYIRKTFFRINILLAIWLFAASSELPHGKLSLFVIILGLIAVLKSIFLLKGKFIEKIIIWSGKQPSWLLRLEACVHVGFALILIFGA